MSLVWVPEDPNGSPDAEATAIAEPATAFAFPMAVTERINWLLASRQGQIFRAVFPTSNTALSGGRVYHNPSVNCGRVIVIALIERASSAPGTITFTPDDGGGTAISYEHNLTTATTPWGTPRWVAASWPAATLVDTSIQYHKLDWTDLRVREVAVFEMPRDQLDTASDTLIELAGANYAGLHSERMITDGTVGGFTDVITGIASARDNTCRHFGWLVPDGSAWTTASASWANVADATLGTNSFGFIHRARQIREAVTSEAYTVRIRAKYVPGTGTGDIRVRSSRASDTADFTSLTTSWAWHAPDGGDTLDIASDSDDTIYPEGIVTNVDTTVHVSSIQFLPA